MPSTILLNKAPLHLTEANLPCLVHYQEKQGGSQFTITLLADLFSRGSKVLSFTAYSFARDNFCEETKGMEEKIFFVEKKEDLAEAQKYQAILLNSGDEVLFLEALRTLSDIQERVVLVKNFEVFSANVLEAAVPLEKVILSGNLDQSVAKKSVSAKNYETYVAFCQPETSLPVEVPYLEKYVGYLKMKDNDGLVGLQMETL